MTAEEFRALALSFPDATEAPHFDRTSFRARTIFATMAADGSNGMVRVQPVERALALIESYPDVFFSFGGYTTKHGSMGIHLAAVEPGLVRALMAESYDRAAAPKKRTAKPRA